MPCLLVSYCIVPLVLFMVCSAHAYGVYLCSGGGKEERRLVVCILRWHYINLVSGLGGWLAHCGDSPALKLSPLCVYTLHELRALGAWGVWALRIDLVPGSWHVCVWSSPAPETWVPFGHKAACVLIHDTMCAAIRLPGRNRSGKCGSSI